MMNEHKEDSHTLVNTKYFEHVLNETVKVHLFLLRQTSSRSSVSIFLFRQGKTFSVQRTDIHSTSVNKQVILPNFISCSDTLNGVKEKTLEGDNTSDTTLEKSNLI